MVAVVQNGGMLGSRKVVNLQVLKWIYRHSLRKTRLTMHTTPTFSTPLTCQFDFKGKYMTELQHLVKSSSYEDDTHASYKMYYGLVH